MHKERKNGTNYTAKKLCSEWGPSDENENELVKWRCRGRIDAHTIDRPKEKVIDLAFWYEVENK
jgi:hypothetical protein